MPYFLLRHIPLSILAKWLHFVHEPCVFLFFCMWALCKVQNCLPDLRQRNCSRIVMLSCTRENIVSCSVYMAVKQTDDVNRQRQRPKEWLYWGHSAGAFHSELPPIPSTVQGCAAWHMSTDLYNLLLISQLVRVPLLVFHWKSRSLCTLGNSWNVPISKYI